jgi:pimeloyl-ACP methyl ester carboxylesterase
MSTIKNVVLVHGSFVDGAGWESVFHLLTRRGYNVSVVQIPTTTLEADLAATKQILDQQDGDIVLVGHSYGGVVISEAGNHPKVKRLVYVAAFAADAGESVVSLIANPPPILPPQNGFLLLDQSKFAAAFAADVEPDKAAFMAKSQLPWGVVSAEGAVAKPAWKTKPSFYLVTTEDGMVPPPAQRKMAQRAGATVREVPASHAVYVSKPGSVADIIEAAAAA